MNPQKRKWIAYSAIGLALAFSGGKSYAELEDALTSAQDTQQTTTSGHERPETGRSLAGQAEKPFEMPSGLSEEEQREMTRSWKSTINKLDQQSRGRGPHMSP